MSAQMNYSLLCLVSLLNIFFLHGYITVSQTLKVLKIFKDMSLRFQRNDIEILP